MMEVYEDCPLVPPSYTPVLLLLRCVWVFLMLRVFLFLFTHLLRFPPVCHCAIEVCEGDFDVAGVYIPLHSCFASPRFLTACPFRARTSRSITGCVFFRPDLRPISEKVCGDLYLHCRFELTIFIFNAIHTDESTKELS
jgi:hypothetical protein